MTPLVLPTATFTGGEHIGQTALVDVGEIVCVVPHGTDPLKSLVYVRGVDGFLIVALPSTEVSDSVAAALREREDAGSE